MQKPSIKDFTSSSVVKIILKASKVNAVRRRHPWIFSGAIQKIEGKVKEGDIVSVFSPQNQHLATGYYSKQGSIAVRILTFEEEKINLQFWKRKLQKAYDYRRTIGLIDNEKTNVFRLINAEGDGLSGLIIDYYNGTAVLQAHSVGIYKQKYHITNALQEVLGENLKAVYDKSVVLNPNKTKGKNKGKNLTSPSMNPYLLGELQGNVVTENGHLFRVDWEEGQKTGFFIDQRNNRQLLSKYVAGKSVLNTFCYSGGFSVYALKANAKLVHSVDSSQKAIDWTNENVSLNGLDEKKHKSFTADVLQFLKELPQAYDVIVLDPPAFAKSLKARHRAMKAYRRLNAKALKQIKSGGILFTFSCSGVVERQLFEDTVRSAAIEVGREIRILHYLSQPEDHPINIFHREGHYLKGLVLYVV